MHVLIIDDSEDVRSFLGQLLRDQGHAVREAGNGQEGLASVREQRPDAIICDGLMPVMDGFQLLQALKRDSGLSSIPFIFLSSVYIGQREQDLAISLGADAFLVKPQPPKAILDALQAVTGGRVKIARTTSALTGDDAASAREYSLVVATALEGKVKELRTASDEWRATFDAMTEAVALLDADGRIMRCNKAMATLAQKPFSELLGRACTEMCACFGGRREECPFAKSKRTLKRETVVFKQGERWFEASADPILDKTGALQGAVHILQEITERKHAEEILKKREAQLTESQRIAGIGSWERDLATNAVAWSKELFRIFGLDPAKVEPSYALFRDLMHQEDREAQIQTLQTAIQDKKRYSADFRIVRPDGTTAVVHSQGEVVCDEAGRPVLLRGTAQDITKRKYVEEALRASEERYRDLFENANDAIFLLDSDQRFTDTNKAGEALTGYTREELVNMRVFDMIPPEQALLSEIEFEKLRAEGSYDKFTGQIRRKDGSMVDIDVSSSAIIKDGRMIGSRDIVRDITERRKTEAFLQEQQQFTENLIMNSAIATFVVDADHSVLIWNKACEELTGIPAAAIVGTKEPWKAFYDHERPVLADIVLGQEPEKLSSFYDSVSLSTLTRDGIHAEGWFKNLNTRDRYIVFDAAPIRDASGAIIAAIETLQDFTDHKKLEVQIFQAKQDWEYTFNSITDMVTVHDKDYNIILANKAAERILGLPLLEKKKDQKCFAYYHGTAHAPEGCPSCSCLQTGTTASFEIFEPHLGIFIEIRAIPRFDSNNKLIGLIHVVRDITEQKRAQGALNDRVHQAALGAEIGVALTSGGGLQTVLQHCAEAMVRHLDAAFARIWTLNEADKVLEMQASAGIYTHIDGPHGRVPVGKFKIGLIAEERKPHFTNHVVGDPRVGDQEWAKKEGMVAFAGYPLIVQDRLVGVMALFSRNQLAETTLTALGSVADIVALGIERKRTEESLARYSKQLTALNTASNTLLASTSLSDIYQEICNIIYSVFDLRMVWLGIIEESSYDVRPVAHAGQEDGYLSTIKITWDDSPTGRGPTGIAVKTRKPCVINSDDPLFEPWRAEAKKRGYWSSMAVPLLSTTGDCLGVLNYYGGANYFTPDSMKLTQIFANQAAIAIENARLVAGLETKVFERTRALEDTNVELQTVNQELGLRREEAEAASRSKTDFLANMSHELRTPLNAIMGFSEIMLMGMAGPVSEKQREFLGDISKSGSHLLSLINDILDLSKVEAGKMELERELVIVGELVSGSMMMFKEKALKHSIKLESSIDPELPQIVADRRKLKQVLVNLLSNAFKFTPDGGSVSVRARRVAGSKGGVTKEDDKTFLTPRPRTPDPDLIEFTVTDNGFGIEPQHQQMLFQRFQQIDSSLTRKHAGTGLGLSLCRRFVELHGGRIWVESELGKGSTFRFVIPVKQP